VATDRKTDKSAFWKPSESRWTLSAAFNIKDTFLDPSDTTGFSVLVRELLFSESIEVHHIERYWHRLSMEGNPLAYFALVLRKKADLPAGLLERVGMVG